LGEIVATNPDRYSVHHRGSQSFIGGTEFDDVFSLQCRRGISPYLIMIPILPISSQNE
jgi:hypothetical protein